MSCGWTIEPHSGIMSCLGSVGGWCGGSEAEGCGRMWEDEVRKKENGTGLNE